VFETHLTVIGTLITEVHRRRLTDDTTVVNFRVASNERRFNRATESWTDGDSLYVSVTCWRQLAENVHHTFNLGDPIIVRGRLHTRNYEDKEGRRQSVIELEGLAVGPDLTRSTARITRLRRDGTPLAAAPPADTEADPRHASEADPQRDTERSPNSLSDDPWSTAGEAADGSSADRELGDAEHEPGFEAAVGA
jgi:single-strand DNA-binding protein